MDSHFESFVTESSEDNGYYFTGDIITTAKQLDYFANIRSFK